MNSNESKTASANGAWHRLALAQKISQIKEKYADAKPMINERGLLLRAVEAGVPNALLSVEKDDIELR